MIPNRYESRCRECGATVPAGAGFLESPPPRVLCAGCSSSDDGATVAERFTSWRGADVTDYQRVGIRWLADRIAAGRGALLADEPGLGKTLQAIAAAPLGLPIGVICPTAALGVWREHFQRLRPDLSVAAWPKRLDGSAFRDGTVSITTYHRLDPALEGFSAELPAPPLLILDEAHMLGNEDTQRTKRVRGLSARVRQRGGSVIALTATPIRNTPEELRSILEVANLLGETPWLAKSAFRKAWGASWAKYGVAWEGKRSPEIPGILRRIMLRREKRDVMRSLPPRRYEEIRVAISREARKACDLAVEALGGLDRLEEALAEAERTKIRGARFEELSAACAALAAAKVPPALEVIDAAGPGVLIWSRHVPPLEAVAASLGESCGLIVGHVPERIRGERVAAFQAGEIDTLALSIGAAGTALTLTRSDRSIFIDEAWTPADNEQAQGRNHRLGSTRPVLYSRLVADHKLDERLAEILGTKSDLFAETVSAARVDQ